MSADARDRVVYVGAPDSLEQRLALEAGVEFIPVLATGWDRARPLTLLTGVLRAIASTVRCFGLLRRTETDVVVGFGGFVSVPPALAAILSGVPLVLHEQNSVPGVANRFLARFARSVCVTYADSVAALPHADRAVITGDPVRAGVLAADREAGRDAYGFEEGETVLLVFGGSRGARHLNTALVGLHARLKRMGGIRVVQIAGPTEAPSVRDALKGAAGSIPDWWQVLEYVEEMGDLMAAADLVVCRAGATTLAEISVLAKASVLVPYPYATDDHQTHNAEPFVRAGASVVVRDGELDASLFADTIIRLLSGSQARSDMERAAATLGRPDAAEAVHRVLSAAAGKQAVA